MAMSDAERQAKYRARKRAELEKLRRGAPASSAEVKRLREENERLRAELKAARVKGRDMPRDVFTRLAKCLHPDSRPTDKQRADAFVALSEWWNADKPKSSRRW